MTQRITTNKRSNTEAIEAEEKGNGGAKHFHNRIKSWPKCAEAASALKGSKSTKINKETGVRILVLHDSVRGLMCFCSYTKMDMWT